VFALMCSSSAIALLPLAATMSCKTCCSRAVSGLTCRPRRAFDLGSALGEGITMGRPSTALRIASTTVASDDSLGRKPRKPEATASAAARGSVEALSTTIAMSGCLASKSLPASDP
jgi:hypothetical protein